jgi:glycosyltransferase involved in cell wall biosynthesis
MDAAETRGLHAPHERLVSVIIPTLNRAGLLSEAMESVFAQSHRPIELIVVDDGSTDATTDTVKDFFACHASDSDFTCRYLRQDGRGPVVARNKGIRISQGRFIQFLDDDDQLHPDKLEKQVDVFLSEPDVDAVVSQTVYCNERMEPRAESSVFNKTDDPDMVAFFLDLRHDVAIHAPLFRRAAIDAVGGRDERVNHGDEVELHLRMAIAGVRFRFTADSFAYVRCHSRPGRRTVAERATAAAAERDFYERIVQFSEARRGHRDNGLRAGVARRLVGIACRHFADFRPKIACGCLGAAREICPEFSSLRLSIYGAPAGDVVGTLVESCLNLATRTARKGVRALTSWGGRVERQDTERGRFRVPPG